ncbi:MAG: hypothetical protein LC660_05505 [Desulfobacteraceae bacterium]|nr:hypothetical protein [Desulfobacteraceae bacterium]
MVKPLKEKMQALIPFPNGKYHNSLHGTSGWCLNDRHILSTQYRIMKLPIVIPADSRAKPVFRAETEGTAAPDDQFPVDR